MSDRGLEYDNRTQWDETVSPLRIAFGRVRGCDGYDWVLPPKLASARSRSLSDYGRMNPAAFTKDQCASIVTLLLDWKAAAALGYYADKAKIGVVFDEDGQWWLSGYDLYSAGLIDDAGRPTVSLSAKQSVEIFGKANPSPTDYIIDGLLLYSRLLWIGLIAGGREWASHYYTEEAILEAVKMIGWRAAHWRREVIDWLAEHRVEPSSPRIRVIPPVINGSSEKAVHVLKEYDHFIKEYAEIVMLAGGIVEFGEPDTPAARAAFELFKKTLSEQGAAGVETLFGVRPTLISRTGESPVGTQDLTGSGRSVEQE